MWVEEKGSHLGVTYTFKKLVFGLEENHEAYLQVGDRIGSIALCIALKFNKLAIGYGLTC